ncbi:hypothetical protein [Chitinophaga sp. HK235]|uniref:hypothetical protein n=1 Tax=Chitinophaga sp. HK235 TaxID=2952571 RepID=UPI001BAD5E7E|nr:hypothetical protein [Chitinophaga sp. HK235]
MNYTLHNWPYQWLGPWKEYGEGYEKYPSIKDFVDHEINAGYDKRLIEYLNNGVIVCVTSGISFPSPFDGEIKRGTVAYRTDGKWLWLDNIADFVVENGLAIPEQWYYEIRERNFIIPDVSDEQIEQLPSTIPC